MPSDDVAPDTSYNATLSLQLSTYTTTVTGKGSKKKKTLKKDSTKTKSLKFTVSASEENYILLLNKIIVRFGLDKKYTATSDHIFSLKLQVPPQKYETLFLPCILSHHFLYRVSQSVDIENASEFMEIAEEIINTKPKKEIVVLIAMNDIATGAKVRDSQFPVFNLMAI